MTTEDSGGFVLRYTRVLRQGTCFLFNGLRHVSSVSQCIKIIAVLARYRLDILVDAFRVKF